MVDGKKIRASDGPVYLRDGSVVQVGKSLILCEMGTQAKIMERRAKIEGKMAKMAEMDMQVDGVRVVEESLELGGGRVVGDDDDEPLAKKAKANANE